MHTLIISIILLLIPSYALFFMGMEIFIRNKRQKLNRLTMVLMFWLGLLLAGQFLAEQLPAEAAEWAALWLMYVPAFAAMAFTLLFYRDVCGLRDVYGTAFICCMLPVSGIAAILWHPAWLGVSILKHGRFHAVEMSGGLAVLVLGCSAYTFAVLFTYLLLAVRKSRRSFMPVKTKRRIRVLVWGSVLTLAYLVCAMLLNRLLIRIGRYEFNDIASHCMLVWAIAVRYAMVKFDFLASESRRYKLLFELSHSGIALLNGKGEIVEANSAFCRLAGGEDDDKIEGRPISSLFMIADWPQFKEQFREAKASLRPFNREAEIINAKGESFIVEVASDFIEINGELYSFHATRDVTEQKRNEHRLSELAYQDPLTGLANRRQFIEKLQEALVKAEWTDAELGVMLIDLDQFKWVNDTLGHTAGDRLLGHMGRKLSETLPSEVIISRLGGDEFAVLLPASGEEVIRCAEALIRAVSEPVTMEGKPYTMTASIGVSVAPQDGRDFETLIRNADTAMYVAKTGGRNQYHLFTPQLKMKADEHMTLVSGLSRALPRNEFSLHYQPQIDLATGVVLGVEALLRWHSSELGLVPPSAFIPVAEETGMIVPIGTWALRTAAEQTKRWVDEGHQELVVAVNLSGFQLREPQFARQIADLLVETGLDPRNLCLEITESTAIGNIQHSYAICSELANMGISLAIDDFGMGYSSISMLNRFPFHFTKIDRSLVQDIVHNKRDLAVIRAVIELSKDLGLKTIAEGVETSEQHDILRMMNCNEAQGYLYGKPMDTEQITAFLNEKRISGKSPDEERLGRRPDKYWA